MSALPDFILPELRQMLAETKKIYQAFNRDFPELALFSDYLDLFTSAELFVNRL